MMNNPDKPNYRTMFELFYVDVGSLLHKKTTTILTLIFMEIYYGTDESKRPRPSCRTGCK